MLHHDNVPCHTALSVTEFFTSKDILVFPSPYIHLSSATVTFIFPKHKSDFKGRHFGTLENIQKNVTDMLKTIPVKDFQRCYQNWEQHLHQCVAAQGNYFDV